jgi:hypothetical protein
VKYISPKPSGRRAKWAHHPKEVRDELRRIGMRPMMNDCHANSQRFFIEATLPELAYVEGIAWGLAHAWLTYRGEILDLTWPPTPGEVYQPLPGFSPTKVEVAKHIAATRYYEFLREAELDAWRTERGRARAC